MLQTDKYINKLPYGPFRDEKRAYREEEIRLYNLFKTDLRLYLDEILGIRMTDDQFTVIFNRAWESGHAEGYQTVVLKAEDLIEVAREFVALRD